MKRIYLLMFVLTFSSIVVGQKRTKKETTPKPVDRDWKFKGVLGFNINQSTFINWAAGGRNSISGTGIADFSYDYKKGKLLWDNDFHFALGGIYYFGDDGGLQKTDDQIHVSSKFGYEFSEKAKGLYLSAFLDFRTQFLNGYNFPNDSIKISKFMAPGYLTTGIGFDYAPPKAKGLFISLDPIAAKFTFVTDKALSDVGAFGVDNGKFVRSELGAYLKIKYETPLGKSVNLKTTWDFFTNYLDKPFQRIDVNAQLLLSFKFNSWFSAFLQLNMIYDHDVDIDTGKNDVNGKRIIGPRTQFRQILGVGINYTFKNYSEPKK